MWIGGGLVLATFVALVWLEGRWPLRRAVEARRVRVGRNLAVAVVNAAVAQLVERPVVLALAATVERRGWGLLGLTSWPVWLEVALALILMDYTLYLWHVLTHRLPWLWRFHVVHHADLDLDASTALRFHAAELVVSLPWRAAQVVLIGVSPRAFTMWQAALLLSTMFHHANVRLPIALERRLCRVVVTPRLHGIHHSIVRAETDSNWSSGLTLWDRLHGTLRLDVPQDAITIGVPAYRTSEAVTLPRLFLLPFRRHAPDRQLPDGEVPTRPPAVTAGDRLLA